MWSLTRKDAKCIVAHNAEVDLNFPPQFLMKQQSRLKVENKSRWMEIMQQTRLEYENGDISFEELDWSIRVSCAS